MNFLYLFIIISIISAINNFIFKKFDIKSYFIKWGVNTITFYIAILIFLKFK